MVFKWQLIVLASVCAQISFTAAVTENNEIFGDPFEMVKAIKAQRVSNMMMRVTNEFIRRNSKVDIDPKKAEPLVNALNKFNKEEPGSQAEWRASFLEILFMGTNITKDELTEIFGENADQMSQDDIKEADEKFRKKLPAEQVEKIMKVVRQLKGSGEYDNLYGTLELILNVLYKSMNKPDSYSETLKELFHDFINRIRIAD